MLIPTICYLVGLISGLFALGVLRSKTDYSSYAMNYGELYCIFWPLVGPGYLALKAFEGAISFGENIGDTQLIKKLLQPIRLKKEFNHRGSK